MFYLVSNKLGVIRNHSFLCYCVLISHSLQSQKALPGFNLNPSCYPMCYLWRRGGIPVESLNIHVLLASSSKGDLLSDSLTRLRRREWEMGARRRLLLLSCTRVFRALESRTEVCCGSGREEEGKKSMGNIKWGHHLREVCIAASIHNAI